MGSCVSVHKDADSAMKLRLSFGSKADKLVSIPPFPLTDDKLSNGDRPIIADPPLKSHWSPSTPTTFPDYGSKEDSFFDTKPWLDSDCEDDFYSVNGDFTPSRGNTPVHQGLVGFSRVNKTPFESRAPSSFPAPSPIGKKKKLLELFQESINSNGEEADNEVKPNAPNLRPKSVPGTPSVPRTNSVSSSERTANGDALTEKERPFRSTQCCLPSLVSCRSSSQRKKMSPTIGVVDKA